MVVTLVNSGVDPKIIGQLISNQPTINLGGGAPQQPMGVKEIIELVATLSELGAKNDKGGDKTELMAMEMRFTNAMNEVKSLIKPPPNPIEQVQATLAVVEAFKQMGIINNGGSESARSIEEMKEKHRHDEAMANLDMERKHKEKMGDIVSSIPERIGIGVARHMRNQPDNSEIQSFKCEKCGSPIYITQETGNSIKCPGCKVVYTRDMK